MRDKKPYLDFLYLDFFLYFHVLVYVITKNRFFGCV